MGKMCFAICDDEKAVRELLYGWLSGSVYNAEIKEYSSAEDLIKDIDSGTKIDVLFLDIAMGGTDGIEAAKALGERIERGGRSIRASRPLIIFVTGIPDRMGDAFGVRAYGYLLKPISKATFESELRRAVEELKKMDAQMICEATYEEDAGEQYTTIQTGGVTLQIAIKNILYVESNGRKTTVHLKSKIYEVYKRMSEFEEELGKDFFRIHRGYLVNLNHIRGYTRTEAIIDSGDSIIISKYKYADFVKAYMDHIL